MGSYRVFQRPVHRPGSDGSDAKYQQRHWHSEDAGVWHERVFAAWAAERVLRDCLEEKTHAKAQRRKGAKKTWELTYSTSRFSFASLRLRVRSVFSASPIRD